MLRTRYATDAEGWAQKNAHVTNSDANKNEVGGLGPEDLGTGDWGTGDRGPGDWGPGGWGPGGLGGARVWDVTARCHAPTIHLPTYPPTHLLTYARGRYVPR